jgi:cyclopropane fatty-acyl-phospholipid synthase-like methyltransferase
MMALAEIRKNQSVFPEKLDISSVLDNLPAAARSAARQVNLSLSPDDGMYVDDAHYLSCGASALNVILAALSMAGAPSPAAILDFGAGAGRVTRWLRAAFPAARISVCDLRAQDIQFCKNQFGAEVWISGTDIGALNSPSAYDLIWAGSVFTHLSAENSGCLIDKLLSWTNPHGLLMMSMIGRTAKDRKEREDADYIYPGAWAQIVQQYDNVGFGYADYVKGSGYGLSLTKLSWAAALVERLPSIRLVALSERVWDDLHDVFALQKLESAMGSANGPQPNAAAIARNLLESAVASKRNAAIEESTLWRMTWPIRAAAGLFGR